MDKAICPSVGLWLGMVGAVLAPLVVSTMGGCQAVVDFDRDRICVDEVGTALDCVTLAPGDVPLDCVVPACDRDSGECVYPADPARQGQPCKSLDPCLIDTSCDGAECVGTRAPDGTSCTPEATPDPCRPGTCQRGVCVVDPVPAGTPCVNDNICQINKVCVQVGTGEDADLNCLGDPDPAMQFSPCDDDNACTTDTSCFNGQCLGAEVSCDDDETCNPETGVCEADEV